jgi:glycosyltransferase involved in cell wall biosynthesis
MVAFHYPPYEGGSGVHRTLKFSRYLPGCGWVPVILSAHPRAYPNVGDNQLQEIPREVIVKRAFALNAARHLAIRGCYLRFMAVPDPWVSWWIGGVWAGLKLVRQYRPEIIWSTYPVATAHLIGLTLHCMTGIPWVADFRDPMTEENYPPHPWSRRSYRWIEKRVAKNNTRIIFTTESTRQMYLRRYPALRLDRCLVIANGYDQEDFDGVPSVSSLHSPLEQPLRLVHAGVIYPDERDPSFFFRALSRLKADGKISANALRVDLRASGSEAYYSAVLSELGISDIVRLLPALSHRKTIEDCAGADGLLLLQAASCNHQIPAKVYEYLRLAKPILALTPDEGDSGKLLKEVGGATLVDLTNEEAIRKAIPQFLTSIRKNLHPRPDAERAGRYSRQYQAAQLSACFSEILTYK